MVNTRYGNMPPQMACGCYSQYHTPETTQPCKLCKGVEIERFVKLPVLAFLFSQKTEPSHRDEPGCQLGV